MIDHFVRLDLIVDPTFTRGLAIGELDMSVFDEGFLQFCEQLFPAAQVFIVMTSDEPSSRVFGAEDSAQETLGQLRE